MKKHKDTSLDDLADAISALATHMDERFDRLENRFDTARQETNEPLVA